VVATVCQQETSRLFYRSSVLYMGCRQQPNTFSEFALVCVWAVIGIMLTAAAIWFGFEIYGGLF
jgi:hypothetical protein